MRAVQATVEGVVQGVGFRYSTRREAERLGIVGWVRNLPDGSVAVWAQGAPAGVEALCAYLERGPRGAFVRDIALRAVTPDATLRDFAIRP
jgi:acylphosphatase